MYFGPQISGCSAPFSGWGPVNGHGGKVPMFINGEFVQSKTDHFIDVLNPATQEVVSQVPESSTQLSPPHATPPP